jgi:outer membrane protein OmpA-like peptidoglycan-associated protein
MPLNINSTHLHRQHLTSWALLGRISVKRFVFFGVLFIITIWYGHAPAADCRLGADFYYRAKSAASQQQRIEWLQRSTAVCPNFNAWYLLGLLFRAQDQLDQAIDAFTQARAVAGSIRAEALALGRNGEILSRTGHLPQALRELELAKQFHPPPAPAWLDTALRNARTQFFQSVMAAEDIASFLDAGLYVSKNGKFTVRPTVNLPVHFDFDRADLNAAGNRQVVELGRALSRAKMRATSFLLVGHTDKRGPGRYNQILSEKRANTVKVKLEQLFPSLVGQLKATGRGETQLLYDGDVETDHRLNRRVKVTLVP